MSKVFNKSRQIVEKAKLMECPRCLGFGTTSIDKGGILCDVCSGWGLVWKSESGWIRAKWERLDSSKLY